ncbi:hypothetical protein MMPV_007927 [Pyropia vietnamensis]
MASPPNPPVANSALLTPGRQFASSFSDATAGCGRRQTLLVLAGPTAASGGLPSAVLQRVDVCDRLAELAGTDWARVVPRRPGPWDAWEEGEGKGDQAVAECTIRCAELGVGEKGGEAPVRDGPDADMTSHAAALDATSGTADRPAVDPLPSVGGTSDDGAPLASMAADPPTPPRSAPVTSPMDFSGFREAVLRIMGGRLLTAAPDRDATACAAAFAATATAPAAYDPSMQPTSLTYRGHTRACAARLQEGEVDGEGGRAPGHSRWERRDADAGGGTGAGAGHGNNDSGTLAGAATEATATAESVLPSSRLAVVTPSTSSGTGSLSSTSTAGRTSAHAHSCVTHLAVLSTTLSEAATPETNLLKVSIVQQSLHRLSSVLYRQPSVRRMYQVNLRGAQGLSTAIRLAATAPVGSGGPERETPRGSQATFAHVAPTVPLLLPSSASLSPSSSPSPSPPPAAAAATPAVPVTRGRPPRGPSLPAVAAVPPLGGWSTAAVGGAFPGAPPEVVPRLSAPSAVPIAPAGMAMATASVGYPLPTLPLPLHVPMPMPMPVPLPLPRPRPQSRPTGSDSGSGPDGSGGGPPGVQAGRVRRTNVDAAERTSVAYQRRLSNRAAAARSNERRRQQRLAALAAAAAAAAANPPPTGQEAGAAAEETATAATTATPPPPPVPPPSEHDSQRPSSPPPPADR